MSFSMNRRHFLGMVGSAGAMAVLNPLTAAGKDRPNIIVILTDDHGYADLGEHGVLKDIATPHADRLAKEGALALSGYSSAPQCVPSRAGLLTGQYQARFGVESNQMGPLPLEVPTLAERLGKAGYVCGHVGKWHLSPNRESRPWLDAKGFKDIKDVPPEENEKFEARNRGFQEYFSGEKGRYVANYGLDGASLAAGTVVTDPRFRIDVQTEGALAFLKRNKAKPFFLYLAYYGPHVPLETPENYLKRFPGPMPERRRHALGCISAIDDGLGRIRNLLKEEGLENTLIFFMSDNGAPLGIDKKDTPLTDMSGWDGSLNDPWIGEKGMLSEGGVRIPFIATWPGRIKPAVIREPVSLLDVAATACELAGADGKGLDGKNLIPLCARGEGRGDFMERPLFWRWGSQCAARRGRYKVIRLGSGRELFFDLDSAEKEGRLLPSPLPPECDRLKRSLDAWLAGMNPKNFPIVKYAKGEQKWYSHYFKISDE